MTRIARGTAISAAIALPSILIVGVMVNFLIYWARHQFITRNPDYVAIDPPTISRAISDPFVGDPFANWMLFLAPVLFVGITTLVWCGWSEMKQQRQRNLDGMRWVAVLSILVVLGQGIASTGMVLLSQFRFPTHNDLHMLGSYVFFFSQGFVVLLGDVLSRGYARLDPLTPLLNTRLTAIRARFLKVPLFLGIGYLALFIGKDFNLGAAEKAVYQVYVLTEPMLITSFLVYSMLFLPDLFMALLRYARS